MKCDSKLMQLYAVTDRTWTPSDEKFLNDVEVALKNGVTCLQLREKEISNTDFLFEAKKVHALSLKYNVPLIINDNVDVAIKCGAEGIHIGQEDMALEEVRKIIGSHMIIGVSVHSVEEAILAESNGADYLGLGAVFSTSTKTDVDVMPYKTLKEICSTVKIPTVAIGGINAENTHLLKDSGVNGIAVVSAIFAAEDIAKSTTILKNITDNIFNR